MQVQHHTQSKLLPTPFWSGHNAVPFIVARHLQWSAVHVPRGGKQGLTVVLMGGESGQTLAVSN